MRKIKDIAQLKGMLLTAGIVFLSLFVVFVLDGFFPFGNGSVAALDLNSQYIPLLYRFYDIIAGTKHFAVDFHIGGGINLYSDTLTEIVNPFNYVLFLFGRVNIYKVVNILLLLYVMSASVSAYWALGKLEINVSNWLRTALSISYGMSYFVAYQYEIIRWMYIVVLFPVLFVLLKRLLIQEKPAGFILLLAYIYVLSLQLGIQISMFSFVYSVCYIICNKNKGVISARKCLITGVSFVSSILIAGPAIIPAVANILYSARSSQNASVLTVISHHGLNNILERLLEISSPVVIGIFVATLWILKKNTLSALKSCLAEVICEIVLVITVILEPSNLLWHLGSYQCFPVRYGYAVVWVGIIIVTGLINECNSYKNANEKANSKKIQYVATACSIIVGLGLLAFVYIKRLMFAQAFASLDISGTCKKETLLVYAIAFTMAVISAIVTVIILKNGISKSLFINASFLAGIMGALWFMAILWPTSFLPRTQNEANYVAMNNGYIPQKVSIYEGHTAEEDGQPLNSALVTGKYSMSAYVPSGESKEYVSAMNKLGYETPWISVASSGGSDISNRLLGIEEGYEGAVVVNREEFNNIRIISDFSSILVDREPARLTFDNRKGTMAVDCVVNNGDYVLLPMAYMKGWESAQGNIANYLGGLLAVEITEATECIKLDYRVPGLMAGLFMMLAGILLVLIFVCFVFKDEKENLLDKLAKVVYCAILVAFILAVYILPTAGLITFMGAKAAGKDLTPYLEISRKDNSSVHTLLSQTMEEDGVHVLVGKNNLMNDKGVRITASDEESGYYRASKAADGSLDKESRWSSENNWENNNHFLQADFRSSKKISAVKINWERTNASQYYIEVSQDGKEWKKVSEFNAPSPTNPQIIYYEQGITGRYLRLHITDVIKNEEDASLYYQNVSVYEMEVYDDQCDSFIIKTPELSAGTNRRIPIPEVPAGYVLKIGGINYDNLRKDKVYFADTIAPVDINLGYELYCDNDQWDIEGFDIVLPASVENADHDFGFSKVNVREWKAENGTLNLEDNETLMKALNNRKDDTKLEIVMDSFDSLGDEGYEINIEQNLIRLKAQTERGIYWGRVTLSHMLAENSKSWKCGTIRDYPEYGVRGFVLDVARRPVPMDMLYRMLDALADNYMNTFQIHLSDNAIISISDYDGTVEGARELFSAYRLESKVSNGEQKLTSDFHYTDAEFRKFISDAKSMGIDVVPEIDTPAHSLAITRMFPELGFDNYPELADTLDVSKPEVLEFATNLWSEYLEGENALFEQCDVLHLGTDEYFGDNVVYSKYVANICSSVKKMAKDKDMRIWASITYNDMDTSAIDKNVQMMVWSTIWSDPMRTYNDGFGIINCLNKSLYIVVGSGNDRLNMDNLKSSWEPNLFYDTDVQEEIPAWSPRMLGACYSMWNEHYCQNNDGPDDEGIYDRFEEPLDVIASKLWNRKEY